jgi:hypothetical protein
MVFQSKIFTCNNNIVGGLKIQRHLSSEEGQEGKGEGKEGKERKGRERTEKGKERNERKGKGR